MSYGRPGGNSNFVKVSPPDRGSFPLDHFGECTAQMKAYLSCLKENQNDGAPCRELSRQYLGCRMDKGLMARVDWEDLGFDVNNDTDAKSDPPPENKSRLV